MVISGTIPMRNPTVIEQLFAQESVLLLPARGEVKVLNEVGARIWSLIDGARTIREIAAMLCAEYAVSMDAAEADTVTFVEALARREMVLLTEAAAGSV